MAKWTRSVIIKTIVDREAAGLPLAPGKLVDSGLYQAATRIFGSWQNAIKAAGIRPSRAQGQDSWPPARILTLIRALARRQNPPRLSQLSARHSRMVTAARRLFGSWPKAIIAAGIDPMKFRRSAPWTDERIIEAILTRALRNDPLGASSVRPQSLATAGIRAFGSWGLALAAAGLDPAPYVSRWTADDAAKARDVARAQNGKSEVHALGDAARAEGLRWTVEGPVDPDQAVINAIHERLDAGKPMHAVVVEREDRALYRQARRSFGSWQRALQAAGLNPAEFRRTRWMPNGAARPRGPTETAPHANSDVAGAT